MAWNEPGGPAGNDPWGKKPKQGNELDEVFAKLKKQVDGLFGGGSSDNSFKPSGKTPWVIAGIIGLVWMASGIYIVDPAERGVVTRFGAFTEEMGPGPHWHLPYPIGQVEKVNVDQIRNTEIGYRSTRGDGATSGVLSEALMLTKDENIVDIRLAVQYKIASAKDYLYQVAEPDATLRQATESAVREVVGKSLMDYVLTDGRAELATRVRTLSQEILDKYNTGIFLTSVNLQDAQPPEQVQAAFADVVKAREDRQRFINEAQAYSNDVIPKARGAAARLVEEANAYKEQVSSKAEGESKRFESILVEYQKAPKVTRERMYLDAMEEVMKSSSKVLVNVESGNNMIYLPLDQMIKNARSAQAASEASVTNLMSQDISSSTTGTSATRPNLRSREVR
jgi:membrane protease subunit HflK